MTDTNDKTEFTSRITLKAQIRFYLSAWASQLFLIGYSIIDSLAVGHRTPLLLGALALGNSIYVPAIVTSTAILSGTTLIIARGHERSRGSCKGTLVSKSVVIAGVLGTVVVTLLQMLIHSSLWSEAGVTVQNSARTYVFWLSIGIYPSMLFRVTIAVCHGAFLSRYGTVLQAIGLVIKCALLWLLPKHFLRVSIVEACAISTTTSFLVLGLLSALVLFKHSSLSRYRPRWSKELVIFSTYTPLLKAGIPIGAAALAELSAFSIVSVEISRHGVIALAAHQIACNVTNVAYSFISAFGILVSFNISRLHGAMHSELIRNTSRCMLLVAAGIGGILMLGCIAFRPLIVAAYSSSEEVGRLAFQCLPIVAAFLMCDSLQTTAASSLRASGYNLLPTCTQIVGLWCGGVLLGRVLVRQRVDIPTFPFNPVLCYWSAILIGASLTAALLCRYTLKAPTYTP